MVHTVSIVCSSSKNRSDSLEVIIVNNIYPTRIEIIVKIISVWSWKNDNCSIIGELASWRSIPAHVGILNERKFFINEA